METDSKDTISELFTSILSNSRRNILTKIYQGFDINTQNKTGCTALHQVAINSYVIVSNENSVLYGLDFPGPAFAFEILRYGADPNIQDESGKTPLHWAALNSDLHMIELLLHFGADLRILDNENNSALHLIAKSESTNIIGLVLLLNEVHESEQNNYLFNVRNARKQTFDQLFKTTLQVKIYNRFKSVKKISLKRNDSTIINELVGMFLKDPSKNIDILAALNIMDDTKSFKLIENELARRPLIENIDIKSIPSGATKSINLMLKKMGPNNYHGSYRNMVRFIYFSERRQFSGSFTLKNVVSGNDKLVGGILSGNLKVPSKISKNYSLNHNPRPDVIDFGSDKGSGNCLFQYACTSDNPEIVKKLIDILPIVFWEMSHAELICSPLDTLKELYPNLVESVTAKLPFIKFTYIDINAPMESCPICRDPAVLGDKWIRLQCRHQFHESCLSDWRRHQNNCPMCRTHIKSPCPYYNSNYSHYQ